MTNTHELPDRVDFTTESGSHYVLSDIQSSAASEWVRGTLDMPSRKVGRMVVAAVLPSVRSLPRVGNPFVATVYGEDIDSLLCTTPVESID